MLTRMYNLGLHARLPVQNVPWKWVVHWSKILEQDLDQRRLDAMRRKKGGRR